MRNMKYKPRSEVLFCMIGIDDMLIDVASCQCDNEWKQAKIV